MSNKKIKSVTIELNEKQAYIVKEAVEEWFRLRMGQEFELANGLAFLGYKPDPEYPDVFNRIIERRNSISNIIKAMFRIAWPDNYGTPERKTPEVEIAIDIWGHMRNKMHQATKSDDDTWCVADGPTFQMGPEPLPKITVETEEADNGKAD